MRVLLFLSTLRVHRKENLALYLALKERIPGLVWTSGTAHDLDRSLDKGKIWLDLVDPDNLESFPRSEEFAADHFDVALINEDFDLTQDQSPSFFGGGIANRSLDHVGPTRPSELARELTQQGTVVIGISRSRRLHQELTQFGGAVMCFHRDQLVRDWALILKEATRLIDSNRDNTADGLKALTLRQPFAWSLFHAGKDVENRNWPAKVRGTIAIHTADEEPSGYYVGAKKFISEVMKKVRLKGVKVPASETLPRGAIIGLVDIVDCVSASDSAWFEGPIGFCLANPRLLPKPIACSGKRRFFKVPAAVAKQISLT